MVVLDIKVKEDIDISNIPTINKQVFLFFFFLYFNPYRAEKGLNVSHTQKIIALPFGKQEIENSFIRNLLFWTPADCSLQDKSQEKKFYQIIK